MMDGQSGGDLDRKWLGPDRRTHPLHDMALFKVEMGDKVLRAVVYQPAQRQHWEEDAPPVEMGTHHQLIIIIIQCLWAAVGPSANGKANVEGTRAS